MLASENLSSRPSKEAPLSFVVLAICCQRLQVRPDHCANSPFVRRRSYLRRSRLPLSQRFLQTFERHSKSDFSPVAEAVGNRLRYVKHLDWNGLDQTRFHPIRKQII